MSAADLTLNITEFKAKCLDVLRRVESGELKKVTVTKRGRALAVVHRPVSEAAEAEVSFDLETWQQHMASIPLEIDPRLDLSRPILEQVLRLEADEASLELAALLKDRAA